MSRIRWWVVLASVAVIAAIGCAASEEQVAAPGELKPPNSSAEVPSPAADTKPQAAVAVDAKTQAKDAAEGESPERIQDPAVKPAAAEEPAKEDAPQKRSAFFRLDANTPPTIPPVVLSKGHAALCKVKVGDVMPDITLPNLEGAIPKQLKSLFGEKATVVVFWNGDRRMTRELLADLGPDVVAPFGDKGVAVVGIAVNEKEASAKAALDKAGAKFANLLDAEGKAFAQVGSERLPRVFLLDRAGKVSWFDIEYSQTTRRELHQALRAVTNK